MQPFCLTRLRVAWLDCYSFHLDTILWLADLIAFFRFKMGPPVFMLITYPVWSSKSNSRFALYFHWTNSRSGGCEDGGQTSSESSQEFREDQARLLRKISRVKDDWVQTIHEVFLPWRVAELSLRSTSKYGNVSLTHSYLGQKLLVVLNPVAGNGSALKR